MDQPQMTVVFSGNELDISTRFDYEVLDLTTYPEARLRDVGKMLPQVWGGAQKVPFLGASVGKVTTLTVDVDDAAVTFDITDEDGVFPSSGSATIGDEQFSYTGKSSDQLTGITRGINATGAAAHSRGDPIQEIKDTSDYIIGNAVNAIRKVYHADPSTDRLIQQLSNVTKYTGQTGDEHSTYPGKAVLTFARIEPFLPSGAIVLFNGDEAPSGWIDFSDGDSLLIVGAGTTYNAGDSGGSTSISSDTDTGGAHSGTNRHGLPSEMAYAGTGGVGEWPLAGGLPGGDLEAGGHTHTIDFTYTPPLQTLKLIEASGGKTQLPASSVMLMDSNSTPTGMQSIFTNEDFLLAGDTVPVTLNPDDMSGGLILINGNLTMRNSGGQKGVRGTTSKSSGKWYFEWTADFNYLGSQWVSVGISEQSVELGPNIDILPDAWGMLWGQLNGGKVYVAGDASSRATPETVKSVIGDVMMVAVDFDAGKIWHGRNGTWIETGDPGAGTNAQYSDVTTGTPFFPHAVVRGGAPSDMASFNFGANAFAYSAPTGFSAWGDASGLLGAEGITDESLEEKEMEHYHYDGKDVDTTAGPNIGRDPVRMIGPNDWQFIPHAHGLDDETIVQNIKRAFLRAYTKDADYVGFVG
ncbi:MAG: hypothetical protein KAT70_00030, partial [Thermoplasmata archaeon]|nr:hypothetical protein [Thermoplasmata archaeon]